MSVSATEGNIIRDEQEQSNLLRVIADIETAIVAARPDARCVMENALDNAIKRVATLAKKIEEAKVEYAAEVQTQVAAAAALAAKETKLSAEERENYQRFLEKSYFTKKDFGQLDEFYSHSYDRLGESGKEEMSKRIHEGIKRGEFKDNDLPESVLKRDAKLYRDRASEPISQLYHADDRRPAQSETSSAKADDAATPKSLAQKSDIDFSSVDLKGIRLVAATSEPTSASIPSASVRDARMRS